MKLSQMCYLPIWFLKNAVFGKHGPLQTVLLVTDHCNLRCKHCSEMGHACTTQKSFEQIERELRDSFAMGSRFVDLEGGEPTLWQEGSRTINDLIVLAKEIGFYSCTVTTNAQRDFSWVDADLIWMSLDGVGKFHDLIRGDGAFEKLERNAALFAQKRGADTKGCVLGANMAVNALNMDCVADTLEYVKNSPYISSIAVNFHTPYPGTEELMICEEDRARLIDLVIDRKKRGYPVQNSVSGLKIMKQRGFKKYCWVSNFIITDGTRLRTCPGETLGICDDCGFCMAGEMYSVMHLKPDTLLAGMDLRF